MEKKKENIKLTARQQRFIDEYCIDQNGKQAAIRAGYKPRTAEIIASQNLRKLNVKQAIDKKLQKKAEQCDVSAEYVINSLKAIADSKTEKTTDRTKALELLGKYLKLFTEKVESNNDTTVRVIIDDNMQDWAE